MTDKYFDAKCVPPLEPPPCGCTDTLPSTCPPLTPGVYKNATITVDMAGCIVKLEEGKPFEYTPQICCCDGGGSSGDGGQGLRGEKGDRGEPATISIGSYSMVGSSKPLRIWNTGTKTDAVLNFEIPMSLIDSNQIPDVSGITSELFSGSIEVENGLIKSFDPVVFSQIEWLRVLGSLPKDEEGRRYLLDTTVEQDDGVATVYVDFKRWHDAFKDYIDSEIQKVKNWVAANYQPKSTYNGGNN